MGRPGAPELPTRTLLFAIPPGATPHLAYRVLDEHVRKGMMPRALPDRISEPTAEDEADLLRADDRPAQRLEILTRTAKERRAPDPAIYEGDGLWPERAAWLGRIGVLRDQRYVAVHVAPVRWDATVRGLRVAGTIVLDLTWDGAPPLPVKARPEPHFESIYAETFVNYEQGKRFRLSSAPAPSAPLVVTGEAVAAQRLRIPVIEDGIVQLTWDRIAGTPLETEPMSHWRLTAQGVAVPLQIQDDGDDLIEPGEWVRFYGNALLGEPKTVLSHDFPEPHFDLFAAADFSDENVYFLSASDAPQAPMAERDAAPVGGTTPPEHFEATVERQIDNAYRPLGGADPWYWLPTLVGTAEPKSRTETIELPGLFSPTLPLDVRVNVRGSSEDPAVNPDHLTRVVLSNAGAEDLASVDAAFDGRTLYLHDLAWEYGGSGPTATDEVTVMLEALPGGGQRNDVILDYIEVRYRRGFTADAEQLEFHWPNETIEFEVDGLLDPAPEVYEIREDPAKAAVRSATRLTGATVTAQVDHTVRFRIEADPTLPQGARRTFLVAGESAARVPAPEALRVTTSLLRDTSHQADLIVIAHPDLLDTSPSSALSRLLDFRATEAGGGLTSIVAELPQVYDEFNDGLSGPWAIRGFLRWVMSTSPGEGWAEPKPAFVMLLGDGSFDYKGGEERGNFVPTQILFKDDPILGYYASDNVMAAVVGDDQLADLLIGRIPGRSLAQVELVLEKTLAHQEAPPPGPWRNHFLLLSDRGSSSGAGNLDFETIHNRVQGLVCSEGESVSRAMCPGDEPFTSRHVRYYSELYINPAVPDPPETMRQIIKDAVNGVDGFSDGTSILSYAGHGNFVVWSNDAFFDERFLGPPRDTEFLFNGGRQPFLMAHNCLTGGFHIVESNNIAEDWVHRDGGGAIGVFAPTGLSFNYVGQTVSDTIWKDWLGRMKVRDIATPILHSLAVLCAQDSIEPCQHYVLLGDPALRLPLQSAAPASGLQAQAGNAVVELQWTPSEDAGATYDVFRSRSLAANQLNYQRINATPLAAPSFVDTDVVNARQYYYYVQAIDADGFRSTWTNFNSDCDVDGPDCVTAVPLNPDPPATPTGLTTADPGLGTQIRVQWAPNSEDDLAYYTLHVGTTPGVYDFSMEVGLQATASITGLLEGQEYYFAVSATNTSSKTSALSDPATDFPIYAPGLRMPRFIDDLRLVREGDDLAVEWSEVGADVYGKPAAIAGYEILRGNASNFANADLVSLGFCPSPCQRFVDVGAAVTRANLHYRVRAVTDGGLASGLGSDYPDGTTLRLGRDPLSGDLVLGWDPVQRAAGGGSVDLAHYVVFASDQPFTIEDARAGKVPALTTTGATSLTVPAADGHRYYSVLAVDARGQTSLY